MQFWPFYLLALAYVEFALLCVIRRFVALHVVVAVLVLIALLALFYWTFPTPMPGINPVAYFVVTAWMFAAPIALLSAGARWCARANSTRLRHASAASLAVGVVFVWPIFGLISACAAGDCL